MNVIIKQVCITDSFLLKIRTFCLQNHKIYLGLLLYNTTTSIEISNKKLKVPRQNVVLVLHTFCHTFIKCRIRSLFASTVSNYPLVEVTLIMTRLIHREPSKVEPRSCMMTLIFCVPQSQGRTSESFCGISRTQQKLLFVHFKYYAYIKHRYNIYNILSDL